MLQFNIHVILPCIDAVVGNTDMSATVKKQAC